MYARKSPDAPRLGLAIAKKKVPLASNRNRIKRLIREQFRLSQANFPPVDIIVMATGQTKTVENAAIISSFHALSRRLKQKLNEIDKKSDRTSSTLPPQP